MIEAASCLHVSRNELTPGGTVAAISAIKLSGIGPGPLGIADTSPIAEAPASIAIHASSILAMQQIFTRGLVIGFITATLSSTAVASSSSLCNLCVLCVSVVGCIANHRDTENTEIAQRRNSRGYFEQPHCIIGSVTRISFARLPRLSEQLYQRDHTRSRFEQNCGLILCGDIAAASRSVLA